MAKNRGTHGDSRKKKVEDALELDEASIKSCAPISESDVMEVYIKREKS